MYGRVLAFNLYGIYIMTQPLGSRIGEEMGRMMANPGLYTTFFDDFYVTPPLTTAGNTGWNVSGTGSAVSQVGQALLGGPINNVEGNSVLVVTTGTTSGNTTIVTPACFLGSGLSTYNWRINPTQTDEFLLAARMGSFSANARVFVGLAGITFPALATGASVAGFGHFGTATLKATANSNADTIDMQGPNTPYVGLARFDEYAIQWKNRILTFYLNGVEQLQVAKRRGAFIAADEQLMIAIQTSTAAVATMGIDYLFFGSNRVQGLV